MRGRQGGGIGSLDEVDEFGVGSSTVDVTRVITEEDATERRKGADQVGFPGDWSFDAVDIVGGGQRANHSARHGC